MRCSNKNIGINELIELELYKIITRKLIEFNRLVYRYALVIFLYVLDMFAAFQLMIIVEL